MNRRYATEEWICIAEERWGGKYDYSKVEYQTKDEEVIIGCPVHGFIPIKPSTHTCKKISNTGCPKCGEDKRRRHTLELNKAKRKTQKQVIRQFKERHGHRYDYSKVRYNGADKKVTVICKVEGHNEERNGEFDIIPNSHIEGYGCPDCFKVSITDDLTGWQPPGSKLTVLQLILDKKKHGIKDLDAYWLVQCACGREPHIVGAPELKKVKACNVCAQRDRSLRRNKRFWETIKDKKFGLLTIQRDWGTNKYQQRKVLCSCDCGRTHITQSQLLIAGHTSSCGCMPKGQDNYLSFLKDDKYANEDCYFYIAEIDDDFIKPGITNDLNARKLSGAYKSYLFTSPVFVRCEAWVIEQIILFETMNAYVDNIPEQYSFRNGLSEYRHREKNDISSYLTKYHNLIERLSAVGWDQLYTERFSPKGEAF